MNRCSAVAAIFVVLCVSMVCADVPPRSRADLEKKVKQLDAETIKQFQKGDLPQALRLAEEAVAIYRELYPASQYPKGRADFAFCLNGVGFLHYTMKDYAKAVPAYQEALAMRRRLFPLAEFPNGHPEIAISLNNVGNALRFQEKFEEAEPHFKEALAMRRKLYPIAQFGSGHPQIATSLLNLGNLHLENDRPDQARPLVEECVAMSRRLYPASRFAKGHPELVKALTSAVELYFIDGAYEKAIEHGEELAAMLRQLDPDSQPLLKVLQKLGALHHARGEYALAETRLGDALSLGRRLKQDDPTAMADILAKLALCCFAQNKSEIARRHSESALDIYREAHSQSSELVSDADLSLQVQNHAQLLHQMGELDRSLALYEESLTLQKTGYPVSKFPNGHRVVATTLSNVGQLLKEMGLVEKAIQYGERAVAMNRGLYVNSSSVRGRDDWAVSLDNLGHLYGLVNRLDDSLRTLREAAVIWSRLYPPEKFPNGHRRAANNLTLQGETVMKIGEVRRAESLLIDALSMRRKLFPKSSYPDGHEHLAGSLSRLGRFYLKTDRPKDALPLLLEATTMEHRLLINNIGTAAEVGALAMAENMSASRNVFLSTSIMHPNGDATEYQVVWDAKAVVTRILEGRQAAARSADPKFAAQLERLRALRQRGEAALRDDVMKPDERDRVASALADERTRLERELARALPARQRSIQRDRLGAADLIEHLPPDAVFVDCILFQAARPATNNGRRSLEREPRYLAFVLAKGKPVKRIDLGPAGPIDRAIADWRRDIEVGQTTRDGAKLRSLVWDRVKTAIPIETRTLFISPDGDLARIPWSALPDVGDQVLLERFRAGIAIVPHGLFLLDQLYPWPAELAHRPKTDGLLAVGNVDFGPAGMTGYPPLPGAEVELRSVRNLYRGPVDVLEGVAATASQVRAKLPTARYVHLATHGFFAAAELSADRKRQEARRAAWSEGDQKPKPAPGEHPLAYTGLVLAGANRSTPDNSGVLSGFGIVDLPLDGLELCVLSACETGLGDHTAGEGTQALQRAFHLAGCPSVVASLWKVNDAATAALMARFYHELWVIKKPPIEALREAQLFIFYNPDKIPDVLGERGAPKRMEALAVKSANPRAGDQGAKRADTKLWAAFVLSGVGNYR